MTSLKLLRRSLCCAMILSATFGLSLNVGAQTTSTTSSDFTNVGSGGSTFTKIGVGARAAGMAGGFSALADDITALYWNPAGIAHLQGISANASYTAWFAGITHNFIGAVMPISEKYRFGVSLTVLDNGTLNKATIDKDINAGTFNANDMSFGLTFAGALTDRFSFGATVKYLRSAILDLSADGLAFDAGSLYQTDFYHLKISLALTNLGPDRSFDGNSLSVLAQNTANTTAKLVDAKLVTSTFSLPLSFRIGVGTDVFQGEMQDQKLNVGFDFAAHSDGPETYNLGGEYVWNDMLALRGGYAFNQDQFGLGLGAGFKYKTEDFMGTIDYAINTTKSLGTINRISVSAQFR
ncbi:MAG: PorV/PorQ family protein [Bacteroidetes bacterium]|nr:PorV/PorQ family protein [Bacteroidota bacterium]